MHEPQISAKSKSPNRSPVRKHEPLTRLDSTPNHSRKSSPNNRGRRSESISPKPSKRNSHSPKSLKKNEDGKILKNSCNGNRSPKKFKSNLKQPSRSLSIENPTCVECYLSGKQEKG